jgi:hypothetical protein
LEALRLYDQTKNALAYEVEAVRKFDLGRVTPDAERLFLDPANLGTIELIPNSADLETLPLQAPAPGAPPLLFSSAIRLASKFKMPPNSKCLRFQNASDFKMPPISKCLRLLIKEVLTRVRFQADVTFRIVGSTTKSAEQSFRKI